MEIITSVANAKVRWLKELMTDKKARDAQGLFVADGLNIVGDLDASIVHSYVTTQSKFELIDNLNKGALPVIVVTDEIMKTLSDTKSPQGIMAVCKKPIGLVDCMSIAIIADNLQDPGNMGTIIRTMTACGVKNLLLYGECVDVYSPKVVRATMGAIAKINVAKLQDPKFLPYERIFALDMGGENIFKLDKSLYSDMQFALVVGGESRGISQAFNTAKTKVIALPMSGEVESLNAAISLSVALYHLINS